jgi:hypothetical protein
MKRIDVGDKLVFPPANTLAFRALSVIELPDGTKEVEAFHIPYDANDEEILGHYAKIRNSGFMRQYLGMQAREIPLPDTLYRVNFIIPMAFPVQIDANGAAWTPSHARHDCPPFILKRLL